MPGVFIGGQTHPKSAWAIIPNALTFFRLAIAGPLFFWAYTQWPYEMNLWYYVGIFVLYAFACSTDFLDGYLARYCDWHSRWGKTCDPIADKVFVLFVVCSAIWMGRIGPLEILLLAVHVFREVGISVGRHVFNFGTQLDVTNAGKWKAGVQMVMLGFIIMRDSVISSAFDEIFLKVLWTPFVSSSFESIGSTLLLLSAVLTVRSGLQYAVVVHDSGKSSDDYKLCVSVQSGLVAACAFAGAGLLVTS